MVGMEAVMTLKSGQTITGQMSSGGNISMAESSS